MVPALVRLHGFFHGDCVGAFSLEAGKAQATLDPFNGRTTRRRNGAVLVFPWDVEGVTQLKGGFDGSWVG